MEEQENKEVTTISPNSQHHDFGPSSLERRDLCPGSYAIESLLAEPSSTPEAQRGTRIHAAIAAMLSNTVIPEVLNEEEKEVADKLFEYVLTEKQVNGWTDEMLFPEKRLSYGSFSGELYFGTADLVVVDKQAEMLTVFDWKTGRKPVAEAADNFQGAAYALAAMQTFMLDTCRVVFYNPCINQLSDHVFVGMDGLAKVITGVISKANEANAPRFPGEKQCRYCKGALFGTCPEYIAELETASKLTVIPNRKPIKELTDAQVVELYGKCKLVDKLKSQIEDELKSRIESKGECAGWTMKSSSGGREATDVNGIYSVLEQTFTVDEFISFCSISVSALEKAYAKKMKGTNGFKTEKDAKANFAFITSDFISEKAPRRNLTPPKGVAELEE